MDSGLKLPDLQLLGLDDVQSQTGPIRQRVELRSKNTNCDMELFAFYILVRTQIADILEIYGAFYELFHNKQPGNSWEHTLKLRVFQDVKLSSQQNWWESCDLQASQNAVIFSC